MLTLLSVHCGPRSAPLAMYESRSDALRPGEMVPRSGIYRAYHRAHRLPQEVYFARNDEFPRCKRCGGYLFFRFLLAGTDAHQETEFVWREAVKAKDPDVA